MEELIDLIVTKMSTVYFTGIGKSRNMAYHCSDLLKCIGLKSVKLDPVEALHGDMGSVSANDIVIFYSNSGNTMELKPLLMALNHSDVFTVGVCSNQGINMFRQHCDHLITLEHVEELDGYKIPTSSCMIQLQFSNQLVVKLADKMQITEAQYKKYHPGGSIGQSLRTVREEIILDYPSFEWRDNIQMHDVLLKMTEYRMGVCIFVDEQEQLVGILLDGDIRRMYMNAAVDTLQLENINQEPHTITNLDEYITDINKHYKYVPILVDNKVYGIIDLK